jgi:hypothetical protein
VIDGLDTRVANRLLGDGCTMSDEIANAAEEARRHGGFVAGVTLMATRWVRQGLITNVERARIVSAAAKSEMGKG